jgi:hypothetical protein
MSNFELIDDYISQRLAADEQAAFEKQMADDLALKKEVEFQQAIITTIKNTRAAELKAMLNKVPVSGGSSIQFSTAKLVAGIIGLGILSVSVYFVYKSNQSAALSETSKELLQEKEQLQQEAHKHLPDPAIGPIERKVKSNTDKAKKSSAAKGNDTNVKISGKTSFLIEDPMQELGENSGMPSSSEQVNRRPNISNIAVEIDSSNERYNFHYHFAGGKLFLYGPFDKSLFEILEINTESHLVFLYYKSNFYLLDDNQLEIATLKPVTDEALLQKLKEYRGK